MQDALLSNEEEGANGDKIRKPAPRNGQKELEHEWHRERAGLACTGIQPGQ